MLYLTILFKYPMIAVILPTYNEVGNIGKVIQQLDRVLPKTSLIIVVDDGSPDRTADYVETLKINNRLHVIRRNKKQGLGTAIICGMKVAIDNKAEAIITLDADLSHDPEVILNMLSDLGLGYDLVIGSRYVYGADVRKIKIHRMTISKIANILISLFLGVPVLDATSGYRIYKTSRLTEIDLELIRSKGYSFQWEMLYILLNKGISFKEIPIDFKIRASGKSKLNITEIFNSIRLLFFYTVISKILK